MFLKEFVFNIFIEKTSFKQKNYHKTIFVKFRQQPFCKPEMFSYLSGSSVIVECFFQAGNTIAKNLLRERGKGRDSNCCCFAIF